MLSKSFQYLIWNLLIGFSIWGNQSYAQSSDSINLQENSHPKIGVVLSGGGALGMAHIGVLKVLEERGIKPDFIVGTSMGSVVGGLYALGYTADEITELTRSMNWEAILSSYIPLTYVAYEEKQDYNRYTISFPFKKGKPTLPTGLIEGQLLLEVLTEFTWSGINYKSFDDYPIPFRCVAVDVSTGKEKIFDHGSLALAMRASMAIPTIFTAVNMDSTLYIDGGAINNYPVDLAKDLGADFIIGSDVTTGILHAYEIDNMAGILYQIAMYPSLLKMKSNIALTDVYIHPDVSDFTASDFTKSDSIIKTGVIAANKQLAALDSLCNAIGYQPQKIESRVANYPDTIHLSGINYNTEDPLHISQIEDHLECTSGTDLAIKSNKHDVRLLYGSLKYKTISYWASPDSNQANSYNFDIHFDQNPRTNLKVGIHYDNVFSVGIVTNFTTHDYLVKKSRMKLKLDISPNFKGEIELLKHLGKKNYFNVLVDYSYMNLNTPIFSDGDLSEYIRNSIHQFTAKFQTNKTLNSKLGVGYYYLQYNGKSLVGNETLKNIKLRNSHDILFAEFHFNSLNKNYHPTWGSQLSLRTDFVMSNIYKIKYPDDQEYLYFPVDSVLVPLNEQQMNDFISDSLTPSDSYINVFIKYKQIFRISKNIKFITNIGTAVTIGPTDNTEIYRSFNTGGNVHLFYFDYQAYGLNYNENQSNNLAILRADLMYSPIKNLFVYAGANYMAFKESGLGRKVPTQGNYIDSELFGYGINLAYKTPVGPIEVGASMNNNDSSVRWNFQIGFQF